MRKLVVLFVLLSLPLFAQESSTKAEVFGGYQYLHIGSNSNFLNNGQGFNGWNAGTAYKFGKYVGVAGDFSGSYATISGVSAHIYTYAGGPVISASAGRVTPFVHALFGGTRLGISQSSVSVSLNGFTTMVGGGVDANLNKNFGVRIAQFDWLYYHFGNSTIAGQSVKSFSGSNNFRISTGIVVRF